MAYEKIGFSAGQVLKAEDLNHIEEGIQNKQDQITGAASTITSSNLTSNSVLVSNGNGKVSASGITSYELAQLSGVQENVQEQIDQAELMAKLALPGTLKWDGVIGDRWHLIAEESNGAAMALVHLYDSDLLAAGVTPGNTIYGCASAVEENGIQTFSFAIEVQEDGLAADENVGIIYIPHDNYSLMGLTTLPKRGIYALCYTLLPSGIDKSLMYVNAISIEGFSFPDQCETEAYFEKVETVVGTTSLGDTLTWDGNVGNKVILGMDETFLVRVSSSTPSAEELNSSTTEIKFVMDDVEKTFTSEVIDAINQNNATVVVIDSMLPVAIIIYEDNAGFGDVVFPKAGTYLFYGNINGATWDHGYTSSIYVEGYNFLVEETAKETILKTEHLPADLRHVGAAFDTFVDGNSTIEWDGVIGDRTTVTIQDDIDFYARAVHISDYVPKISVTDQNIIVKWYFDNQPAEFVGSVMKQSEGVYGITIEFNDTTMPVAFIMEQDNTSVSVDSETLVFPKKGIYFHCLSENIAYTLSISAPFLSSYSVQLKESALPSSMFETVDKAQPLELVFEGELNNVVKGELIDTNDLDGILYKIYDSYIEREVLLNNGYEISTTTKVGSNSENKYNYTISPSEAESMITNFKEYDKAYTIHLNSEIPEENILVLVVPKEGVTWEWSGDAAHSGSIVLDEGIYFYNIYGIFRYLNLTVQQLTPTTQIKETALPDSAKNYVVRLPANTQYEMETNPSNNPEIRVTVEESYDNFANILYNGGQIMIDATQMSLVPNSSLSTVLPTVWSLMGTTLVGACLSVDSYGGAMVYSFYFPNGTWTSNN